MLYCSWVNLLNAIYMNLFKPDSFLLFLVCRIRLLCSLASDYLLLYNFHASVYKAFIYLLFLYIVIVLFPVQVLVVDTVTRPVLLYFPSSTKKDWHHSRAWWKFQNTQFTRHEVLVQYLVEEMTSSSAIMPTLIFIRTQTLMAGTTQCQVEYITVEQSLLGLIISRLMKWRFFILYESRVIETAW